MDPLRTATTDAEILAGARLRMQKERDDKKADIERCISGVRESARTMWARVQSVSPATTHECDTTCDMQSVCVEWDAITGADADVIGYPATTHGKIAGTKYVFFVHIRYGVKCSCIARGAPHGAVCPWMYADIRDAIKKRRNDFVHIPITNAFGCARAAELHYCIQKGAFASLGDHEVGSPHSAYTEKVDVAAGIRMCVLTGCVLINRIVDATYAGNVSYGDTQAASQDDSMGHKRNETTKWRGKGYVVPDTDAFFSLQQERLRKKKGAALRIETPNAPAPMSLVSSRRFGGVDMAGRRGATSAPSVVKPRRTARSTIVGLEVAARATPHDLENEDVIPSTPQNQAEALRRMGMALGVVLECLNRLHCISPPVMRVPPPSPDTSGSGDETPSTPPPPADPVAVYGADDVQIAREVVVELLLLFRLQWETKARLNNGSSVPMSGKISRELSWWVFIPTGLSFLAAGLSVFPDAAYEVMRASTSNLPIVAGRGVWGTPRIASSASPPVWTPYGSVRAAPASLTYSPSPFNGLMSGRHSSPFGSPSLSGVVSFGSMRLEKDPTPSPQPLPTSPMSFSPPPLSPGSARSHRTKSGKSRHHVRLHTTTAKNAIVICAPHPALTRIADRSVSRLAETGIIDTNDACTTSSTTIYSALRRGISDTIVSNNAVSRSDAITLASINGGICAPALLRMTLQHMVSCDKLYLPITVPRAVQRRRRQSSPLIGPDGLSIEIHSQDRGTVALIPSTPLTRGKGGTVSAVPIVVHSYTW